MKTMAGPMIALAALAALAIAAAPAAAQGSDIVFEGVVLKTNASALAAVKPSDRTIVVKVSRVVEKPDSIPLAPGDEVTVQIAEAGSAKADTTRTFRTASWIYGKTLALRELPASPAPPALVQRVKSADMVVTGQVTEVRPGPQQRPTKVSEHNPTQWSEAVVRVSSGLKGAPAQNVVVRFPQSKDVRWRDLPSIAQGKAFTLLLHKDTVTGSPRAMLRGNAVQAYTVLSPQDVLPDTQSDTVKRAVAQAAAR